MRHAATIVLVAAVACGGDGTGPGASNVLAAASATSFTGQFGDAIPVTVSVKTSAGLPVPNSLVSFAASDGGYVDQASAPADADGMVKVRWRLAAAAKTQTLEATLGSEKVTFSATATTNPWTTGLFLGSVPYAWRNADEGSQAGQGPKWSDTELGSPPMLWIVCSGGDPDIVVTHPMMNATNGNISRQIDQEQRVAEFWHPVTPAYDKLFAPTQSIDGKSSLDLLEKLVAGHEFNIAFRDGAANTLLAPTFGTAGLSLVLPDMMGMCGGWP